MSVYFFVNYTATTEIYTYWHTLSLHDALPISDILSSQHGSSWPSRTAGTIGEISIHRVPPLTQLGRAFDIKIPVDVVVRRLAECNLAATLGGDATLGAECAVAEAECAGARHEDRLILGRSTASAASDIPVSDRACRHARPVDPPLNASLDHG